jgi:hypothetical protein
MKYALFLLTASIASAQFFPFPGPGRTGSGGGGGGSASVYRGKAVNTNDNSAGSTTISTTGTLAITAGDLVVVLVGGANNPASVACGGQALTQAKAWTAGGYNVQAWYLQNASANAAATCTATFGGSTAFRSIQAANYGGVVTTGALLFSTCNTSTCDALAATSTSRTTANVTTATANTLHLAIGLDWDGGTTHTAANSYNLRNDGATEFWYDKDLAATGTYPSGNFGTVNVADEYIPIYLVFQLL